MLPSKSIPRRRVSAPGHGTKGASFVQEQSTPSYDDFLNRKIRRAPAVGIDVSWEQVHPLLHDWQRLSVVWALRTGRCALFWDCGLGKTFAQVEWARLIGGRSLIVAPLSVARQTVREARKIDVDVRYV